MRLIDADALLEDARCDNSLVAYLGGIETIQNIIDDQPTIEAEPVKHGRWEEGEKNRFWGTKGNYVCSNCKSAVGFVKFNYCPNCGAKMDGGAKDGLQ